MSCGAYTLSIVGIIAVDTARSAAVRRSPGATARAAVGGCGRLPRGVYGDQRPARCNRKSASNGVGRPVLPLEAPLW